MENKRDLLELHDSVRKEVEDQDNLFRKDAEELAEIL